MKVKKTVKIGAIWVPSHYNPVGEIQAPFKHKKLKVKLMKKNKFKLLCIPHTMHFEDVKIIYVLVLHENNVAINKYFFRNIAFLLRYLKMLNKS